MTIENLGLEQPAVEEPPAEEAATVEKQPIEQAAADPETAELEAQSVDLPAGKHVPLSAVIEARRAAREAKAEAKALAEKAAKADELAQWVNQAKPYIDFVQANPDFLKPRDTPQAKQEPADDAEAIEYAKDFDLYTADGKPDAAKARRIIDRESQRSTKNAEEAARKVTAPVAEQVESQAVYGVLQQLGQEKDGDGNAISSEAVNALATNLVNALGRDGARRFLAAPQSYAILQDMVWGAHAKIPKKAKVTPPERDPLHTERAGGKGEDVAVSTQHLGRLGISEERYKASAKGYKPGQANSLE